MHKTLLFFLFIGFSIFTYSQNVIIKGNVIEEGNSMKVAEVIVEIHGTTFVEITNENGEFMFQGKIPTGKQTVILKKENYESKVLVLNFKQGQANIIPPIIISITKQERKRRKKLTKSIEKANKKSEKEIESQIKAVKRAEEKDDKKILQEQKRFEKQSKKAERKSGKGFSSGGVIYEEFPKEETVSPLQRRYAEKLGVTPQEITNIPLYEFIDEWMGSPYEYGGSTKEGVDCSYFAMKIFDEVNDNFIERTADEIFKAPSTERWKKKNPGALQEFDLIFFNAEGNPQRKITHVGVYLTNNRFISATSYKGMQGGTSGVRIDDLSNGYWKRRLAGFGRKIID